MTAHLPSETLVKPQWIKARAALTQTYYETADTVQKLNLHTVCQEAACPNSAQVPPDIRRG